MNATHPSVPYGFCGCGCGKKTPLAKQNHRARGLVKGEPIAFVHGHNRRKNYPKAEPKACECGCGRLAPLATQTDSRLGHTKGQPMRFIRGHANRNPEPWTEEDRGYASPCWICQLSKTPEGYAHMSDGTGYQRPAHRVMWERERGPIPEGLQIDHLCRQRDCVNPDHLEPVTPAENVRRSLAARGLA